MDDWLDKVQQTLPGTVPAADYVARTTAAAGGLGSHRGDTLPLVAACRDEFMVPFTDLVDRAWGPHFAIGSLGGLVLAGTSGIAAAVGHAPDRGLRRFVLYCVTHIGIDDDGTVGRVRRPGQLRGSAACGALVAFLRELESGELSSTTGRIRCRDCGEILSIHERMTTSAAHPAGARCYVAACPTCCDSPPWRATWRWPTSRRSAG